PPPGWPPTSRRYGPRGCGACCTSTSRSTRCRTATWPSWPPLSTRPGAVLLRNTVPLENAELAGLPDLPDEGHAGAVGEGGVRGGVRGEGGGGGGGGRVGEVGGGRRAGPAGRGRPERLGGRHAHVADGQRDAKRHAGGVGGAGVAVGGEGDRHARVQQAAGVG